MQNSRAGLRSVTSFGLAVLQLVVLRAKATLLDVFRFGHDLAESRRWSRTRSAESRSRAKRLARTRFVVHHDHDLVEEGVDWLPQAADLGQCLGVVLLLAQLTDFLRDETEFSAARTFSASSGSAPCCQAMRLRSLCSSRVPVAECS